MKKISFLLSLAFMCMLSLQVHASVVDTIATIGFEGDSLPADWSSMNTSFSSNSHDEFAGEKGLRLRWDTAQCVTSEYEDVGVFSFYFKYTSSSRNNGSTLQILKSTDGGGIWQLIETFTLNSAVYAKDDWHLLSYNIDEENAMIKVLQDGISPDYNRAAGLYIDDLVLTKTAAANNVDIASVSADVMSVSYEDLQFELVDGTDDIYMAHDSIAYGVNNVTVTATTVAPAANINYTKQIVNPAPGESDTAVWEVTAEDGTAKTYKVVVARSEYHCKAGLFTGNAQNRKPEGWSTVGYNYAASSKGNGGLYPGDYIMRLSDKDDAEPGSLTTPKFSQVGTLAFSGKFSESDSTESLIVLTSTDNGTTWDIVKIYSPIDGEIPAYWNEKSDSTLGRVSLSINKQDVMIRFQYQQSELVGDADLDDVQRTSIDDIACKATDYDAGGIVGIESSVTTDVNFEIYPNPASGYIQIKGDVTNVSIYSLSGQLLKQTTQVESINISDLKPGIYLVKGGHQIKQLIVK